MRPGVSIQRRSTACTSSSNVHTITYPPSQLMTVGYFINGGSVPEAPVGERVRTDTFQMRGTSLYQTYSTALRDAVQRKPPAWTLA